MLRTVQVELAKRLPSVEFMLWRCKEKHHRIALDSGMYPFALSLEPANSKRGIRSGFLDRAKWTARKIQKSKDIKKLKHLFNRKEKFFHFT